MDENIRKFQLGDFDKFVDLEPLQKWFFIRDHLEALWPKEKIVVRKKRGKK
jgi:hypothetical protein